MQAVADDPEAAQTVRDFGLDRRWLRRARAVVLKSQLDDIGEAREVLGDQPELIAELLRRKLERVNDNTGLAYSITLSQVLSRERTSVGFTEFS